MSYTPQREDPAKAPLRLRGEIEALLQEKAEQRREIASYLAPATIGLVCDELVDIAREQQIKIGGKVLLDPAAVELLVSILKERHGIRSQSSTPQNVVSFPSGQQEPSTPTHC